ncbi:MAG TPA: CoA-binding protein [Flavobacteriia bacterium]|nr:CoA-binding protein [Flavobacteriia bacterium]
MNKKTLVLGASLKPVRYSNLAIKRLVEKGHDVVAIGGKKGEVAGVKITTEKPDLKGVDTVTLYVNPKRQTAYYDYILSLHPKRVIFNPGTENLEFQKLLEENAIETEIACTLVLLSTGQY